MPILAVFALAFLFYACSDDSVTPTVTPGTTNFWEHTNGPRGGIVEAFTVSSSGHVIASLTVGGVFRSTNNGESWEEINSGLPDRAPSCLAANSSGHLFAGVWRKGMFRSTDNGSSWEEINSGFTSMYIYSLLFNSSGHVFAGGNTGVCHSVDNGD